MKTDYKPIKPMKEIPDQLRKLRRQFLRYQQAEIVYSLSHKKLLELASDAGAIYRFDSTVLWTAPHLLDSMVYCLGNGVFLYVKGTTKVQRNAEGRNH